MLDFRVETFLCVCRHMNFTKAAEDLKITQPGVTQHIHYLEQYYGAKLFHYSNKILTLTPAGEALKNAMLSMKHDSLHLKQKISRFSEQEEPLQFGATLTIGEFFVPGRLAAYMRKNPAARVRMTVNNTKELLALLDAGTIDFALLEGYFPQDEYESLLISDENYVAVCSPEFEAPRVSALADLFSCRILLREEGSGSREILEHYLLERGYSLRDFADQTVINNIQALKQLAAGGCGIAFVYEIAVKGELDSGKLRQIDLPGAPLSHEFRIVWRKNSIYREYYEKMSGELFGTSSTYGTECGKVNEK